MASFAADFGQPGASPLVDSGCVGADHAPDQRKCPLHDDAGTVQQNRAAP
jgi:hypothetical protein